MASKPTKITLSVNDFNDGGQIQIDDSGYVITYPELPGMRFALHTGNFFSSITQRYFACSELQSGLRVPHTRQETPDKSLAELDKQLLSFVSRKGIKALRAKINSQKKVTDLSEGYHGNIKLPGKRVREASASGRRDPNSTDGWLLRV